MKQVGVSSAVVAVMLLAAGVIAEAQQAKKIWRIGYLSNTYPSVESSRSEVIGKRLRELGYLAPSVGSR